MLNDAERNEAWAALKDTPLAKLWPELQPTYLSLLNKQGYRASEWILREGDSAGDFYIVGGGGIQLTLRRSGRTWLVRDLKPGDVFGHSALYLGQAQPAVRATTPCVVYKMRSGASALGGGTQREAVRAPAARETDRPVAPDPALALAVQHRSLLALDAGRGA